MASILETVKFRLALLVDGVAKERSVMLQRLGGTTLYGEGEEFRLAFPNHLLGLWGPSLKWQGTTIVSDPRQLLVGLALQEFGCEFYQAAQPYLERAMVVTNHPPQKRQTSAGPLILIQRLDFAAVIPTEVLLSLRLPWSSGGAYYVTRSVFQQKTVALKQLTAQACGHLKNIFLPVTMVLDDFRFVTQAFDVCQKLKCAQS